MTEELLSNKKEEKYFFNVNIFDEDHVEEEEPEEDLAPPPPMFSEEELAAAKQKAFEEGKQQGIDETKKSRSELIAKTLEKISQETSILSQEEGRREQIYEKEAVKLTLEIFNKLFPLYQERFGFEELKETMTNILKKQQGHKEIAVYVEPDAVEGTEKLLSELSSRGVDVIFQVSADEALSNGACRMSWKDGGAITDPENLAHEIRATIEQVLAGSGAKGHDNEIIEETQDTEKTDESVPEEDKVIEAETTETDSAEIVEKSDE